MHNATFILLKFIYLTALILPSRQVHDVSEMTMHVKGLIPDQMWESFPLGFFALNNRVLIFPDLSAIRENFFLSCFSFLCKDVYIYAYIIFFSLSILNDADFLPCFY